MKDFLDSKGRPLTANQIAQNLKGSNQYREVSPSDAQKLANSGVPVIAAEYNPDGHGHVASVRLSGVTGDSPIGRSGPLLNNIGVTVGIEHQSAAFRPSADVHFYAPN